MIYWMDVRHALRLLRKDSVFTVLTAAIRTLVVVTSLLGAPPMAAQSMSDPRSSGLRPPGLLVDLGGYRMHLLCSGSRSPGRATIVLIAGQGDFAVDWWLVQSALADTIRVCSYDRAGAGWSDPGPEPRTLRQEVAELRLALARAGEQPPFVLVGHSVGALVARLFQERAPHAVGGLVLVDPTHEDVRLGYRGELVRLRSLAQGRPIPSERTLDEARPIIATGPDLDACRADAAAATLDPPFDKLPPRYQEYHLWAVRHPACILRQDDYLPDELAEIHARRSAGPSLDSLPLAVVAAVPTDAPPGVSLDAWRREKAAHMRDLVTLSTRGGLVTARRSGHHIQLDDPGVVLAAIGDVLRAARIGH